MIGPRTKAILAPNLVGNCPDWDRIREIADPHGLAVVEDSCDVLDSWLRGTRTGTRADISVTSFARGHAITAAGNGGLVGVDDDELFDRCAHAAPVGASLGDVPLRLAAGRDGPLRARSPTARRTTWSSCSTTSATTSSRRRSAPPTGSCSSTSSPTSTSGAGSDWQRLDDFFADHEDKVVRPRTAGGRADHVDALSVRAREGLDRTAIQRELELRGIADADGVDRQHPPPARVRRHRPSGAGRRASERRPGDGPGAVAPVHHGLTSDDLGYVIESLADVLSD